MNLHKATGKGMVQVTFYPGRYAIEKGSILPVGDPTQYISNAEVRIQPTHLPSRAKCAAAQNVVVSAIAGLQPAEKQKPSMTIKAGRMCRIWKSWHTTHPSIVHFKTSRLGIAERPRRHSSSTF